MSQPTTDSFQTMTTQTLTFPSTLPLLKPLNIPPHHPHPTSLPFILSVPAHTDLWRGPHPLNIAHNQPTYYHSVPLDRLFSAKVKVSLWAQGGGGGAQERALYDQAGIVLLFATTKARAGEEEEERNGGGEELIEHRWIKAGVEYEPTFGGLKQSVVVTREWSDWSVSDVDSETSSPSSLDAGEVTLTAEIYRKQLKPEEGGGLSSSLFVKVNGKVEREATWVYAQDDIVREGEVLNAWVGFFGARPAVMHGTEEEDLRVRVEELEIVTVLG